ncbi:MAG: hypothetical protein QRY74_02550 [Chlamydia sp.]
MDAFINESKQHIQRMKNIAVETEIIDYQLLYSQFIYLLQSGVFLLRVILRGTISRTITEIFDAFLQLGRPHIETKYQDQDFYTFFFALYKQMQLRKLLNYVQGVFKKRL